MSRQARLFICCLCALLWATGPARPAKSPGAPGPDSVRTFDTYGAIPWADEKARLDNFAVSLVNETADYVGVMQVYAGRGDCPEYARQRAVRARSYLVGYRAVGWNRVFWEFGGYREKFSVTLLILPRGLRMSPSPSVDESEVASDARCAAKVRAVRADSRWR